MRSVVFFAIRVLIKRGQYEKIMVIKLEKVGVILLMGFIFCGKAFSSINKYQSSYSEIRKLYDMNEYTKCVDKSSNIIQTQEKSFLKTKNYILLANLYELQADCLERKGSIDQAVEVIQILLKKLEQFLPQDHVARIMLKVGHIFERAGLYSKALSSFKRVEEEYKHIFPNRFAKYARENCEDIASKQVAVISGEVLLEDNCDCEGLTIKVFNGFEESETKTLKKGEYSIPLFSSTPHTRFTLFAYKKGYKPSMVNMVFEGSSKIVMKKIQLKKLPKKDLGVVAGVIFVPVSGGKRKSHHGIARFKKHTIRFQKLSEGTNGKEVTGCDVISVSSDDDGVYTTSLAPGLYLMQNEGEEEMFKLKGGEVRILNIMQGRILVD